MKGCNTQKIRITTLILISRFDFSSYDVIPWTKYIFFDISTSILTSPVSFWLLSCKRIRAREPNITDSIFVCVWIFIIIPPYFNIIYEHIIRAHFHALIPCSIFIYNQFILWIPLVLMAHFKFKAHDATSIPIVTAYLKTTCKCLLCIIIRYFDTRTVKRSIPWMDFIWTIKIVIKLSIVLTNLGCRLVDVYH